MVEPMSWYQGTAEPVLSEEKEIPTRGTDPNVAIPRLGLKASLGMTPKSCSESRTAPGLWMTLLP